jgi:ribonucleoside-diphosphate reductase alpha chain
MPAETSSKASGTTNGIYPVRRLSQLKGDSDVVIEWAAPETGKLGKYYELAYNIPVMDLIEVYAIFFKFTDQSISADQFYLLLRGQTVNSKDLLKAYFYMTKLGFKSRYYVNMRTSDGVKFENEFEDNELDAEKGCVGGSCTL